MTLTELIALHERQRTVHAERGEIKAACAVDDVLEALKDARRYRWLRDDSNFAPPTDGYMTWPVHGHDHTDACPIFGPKLDAAIDAAMAK